MEGEVGRRPSTLRRSDPVNKASTPPRSRAYAFGTDYGTSQYNERAIDVNDEIYRTPQVGPPGPHITTIPLRTPEPADPTTKITSGNFLTVTTTAPFSDRNGSLRSPRREKRKDEKDIVSANTLERQTDIVRRASRTPRGDVVAQPVVGNGETSWAAAKLAGHVTDGRTPSIRNYWQQNIHNENRDKIEAARHHRPKSYGFPKWRSSDALSASLVASNPVQIPKDSRIPEQRRMKMEQTDKEAVQTRQQIQQSVEPPRRLQKGKSLDSLVMQTDTVPWYDREKIREAVSRESIGNMGVARQRFESGDFSNQQHRRDRSFSSCSSRMDPPPLPPKSEEVQIRQMANREPQDYIENYQSPVYPPSYKQNGYAQSNGGSSVRETPFQYNHEQQLLMLYLRQNPDIATTPHSPRSTNRRLGVAVSDMTRQAMDDVPWRRVELRTVEDEANSYQPQSYSPSQRSGRYVKKPQVVTSAPPPRFRKNEGPRDVRRTGDNGESLIAAEIRNAREREDELRRSRSELGLPTLEDTMDLWRSGQRGLPPINPLRTALSYDHLMQNSSGQLQKVTSNEAISHENGLQYARREENGSRAEIRAPRIGYGATPFKLQNTEDQDVMFYGPPRRQQPQLKRFD